MHSGGCCLAGSPGKRRQQVTPDMTAEMRWLRSPKEGVVSFRVRKQMSYSASLSRICKHTLSRFKAAMEGVKGGEAVQQVAT